MATGNNILVDLQALYQRNFGTRPKVGQLSPIQTTDERFVLPQATQQQAYTPDGSLLYTSLHGVEIWLPVKFRGLDKTLFEFGQMDLPYTVISLRGTAGWIETALSQRRGSAKELYTIDDYSITIKGFFIDRQRVWPYDDLVSIKKAYEAGQAFYIDNALANIFLSGDDRVVIKSIDLLPVEGKSQHVRPFIIELKSDSIFTLELA